MPTPDLFAPLYGSNGIILGATVYGFLSTMQNGGGFLMTDLNGKSWLLTIGTDGRLSTQQITL